MRRVAAISLVAGILLSGVVAPAVAEDASPELQRRFRAQRHLERMGIRHVVATERSVAERDGQRAPEYRARITAPALAYLNGLSDLQGGLPNFRSTVYFVVRAGGAVEFRILADGRITDLVGRASELKIYDSSRLPERVITRN